MGRLKCYKVLTWLQLIKLLLQLGHLLVEFCLLHALYVFFREDLQVDQRNLGVLAVVLIELLEGVQWDLLRAGHIVLELVSFARLLGLDF